MPESDPRAAPPGEGPPPRTTLGTDAIPLVDLAYQHAEVAVEIVAAVVAAMSRGKRAETLAVAAFETDLATFFHQSHCVGVASGTNTLDLMLRAAGVGPDDEVIVPANGRLAMVAAVMRAGAWPVLADCDPVHHLLDPDDVRRRLTPRTGAVVALHLHGQMAPVEEIVAAAVAHRPVVLLEDAAQCAGATRRGDPPGSRGLACAVRFRPGMSLGAYGGGGAIMTDNVAVAARLRWLRESGEGVDPERGRRSRSGALDGSEAIVLAAKLRHLREWNDLRAAAADLYTEMLGGHPLITLPSLAPGNAGVWHRYVVRVPNRDVVLAALQAEGIGAAVHYPVPIHLVPAAEMLGYRRGDFPNAEAAAGDMLSLPIYPGISRDQLARVAATLRRALQR